MSTRPTSAEESPEASLTQPLVLEPVLVERIWGTDNLSPWHTESVGGRAIGEIWLTAETCVVAGDGPNSGKSLREVTAAAPESLGDPRGEGFPLLIKLLFPREKLSVQVHPDDEKARALGMPRGKTECWYVLSAEPGAQVAVGFRDRLTGAEVKAAIADGSLENKLRMIPVKAGVMVFVDAGTVHAIGPGMVVLETQQYSDTTYRLWDYGRPRELHVDAGAAVTRAETAAGLVPPQPMDGFTRLVACEYFAVDRIQLGQDQERSLGFKGKLQILIALGEGCELTTGHGTTLALPRGHAVVLPTDAGTSLLRGTQAVDVVRVLQP